jgi:hypothetical protein
VGGCARRRTPPAAPAVVWAGASRGPSLERLRGHGAARPALEAHHDRTVVLVQQSLDGALARALVARRAAVGDRLARRQRRRRARGIRLLVGRAAEAEPRPRELPGGAVARLQRSLVCDAIGQLQLAHEVRVLVVLEPVAPIALALLLEEAIVCPRRHCFLLAFGQGAPV